MKHRASRTRQGIQSSADRKPRYILKQLVVALTRAAAFRFSASCDVHKMVQSGVPWPLRSFPSILDLTFLIFLSRSEFAHSS